MTMGENTLEAWLTKLTLSQIIKEEFRSWLTSKNCPGDLSEEQYLRLFSFFAKEYSGRKSPH